DNAEEAVNFYTTVFKNSKIENITRSGEGSPGPAGKAFTIMFQLEGQDFMALNGGPVFTFSPAISLLVNCATQAEVDELWEKLSADGEKQRCGWLKDRYGISWQIVPSALGDYLNGPDPEKSRKAMNAMLQMDKLDINLLKAAYEQG
ncbi:MAG: VOC family protein, partial [Chloroflexi bacterium]|nr:VOC family protein [Chloroflexota bacterium]